MNRIILKFIFGKLVAFNNNWSGAMINFRIPITQT
jgi:hypothetical protein